MNIFVATTVLWLVLRRGANTTPIWAIASMVAVIDPQVNLAYQNFRGRILNTLLGCIVGLIFLLVGGSNEWKLPVAMSATVLLSSYVLRVQQNWRIAPTTAALIIAASLARHSKMSGAEAGVRRMAAVMLGRGRDTGHLAHRPDVDAASERSAPKGADGSREMIDAIHHALGTQLESRSKCAMPIKSGP